MKDWTGHKFGLLTVIKFIKYERKTRPIYKWLCKCICGKEKELDINDLKKGSTNSCGCYRKKFQSDIKRKPDGIAAFNNLFYSYKSHCAKNRNYKFELTEEQFQILTKQNCYYCNKKPSQIKKSLLSFYVYNGIDRVDNSKGYIKNNVVACCKECNSKKSGITKEMIIKLYNFFENEL